MRGVDDRNPAVLIVLCKQGNDKSGVKVSRKIQKQKRKSVEKEQRERRSDVLMSCRVCVQ